MTSGSFKGQTGAGEGLLVTSDGVTLTSFELRRIVVSYAESSLRHGGDGDAAVAAQRLLSGGNPDVKPLPPGEPGKDYRPIVSPGGATLPFKIVDGVKVFHLVAEPCKREFAPGLVVDCWGYNGVTPGPTIEAVEGDRVRFYVTNKLPERTSVHWHGVLLPSNMDGVAYISQPPIKTGETFVYEFEARNPGTHALADGGAAERDCRTGRDAGTGREVWLCGSAKT